MKGINLKPRVICQGPGLGELCSGRGFKESVFEIGLPCLFNLELWRLANHREWKRPEHCLNFSNFAWIATGNRQGEHRKRVE
jgi:hypothetical protein